MYKAEPREWHSSTEDTIELNLGPRIHKELKEKHAKCIKGLYAKDYKRSKITFRILITYAMIVTLGGVTYAILAKNYSVFGLIYIVIAPFIANYMINSKNSIDHCINLSLNGYFFTRKDDAHYYTSAHLKEDLESIILDDNTDILIKDIVNLDVGVIGAKIYSREDSKSPERYKEKVIQKLKESLTKNEQQIFDCFWPPEEKILLRDFLKSIKELAK